MAFFWVDENLNNIREVEVLIEIEGQVLSLPEPRPLRMENQMTEKLPVFTSTVEMGGETSTTKTPQAEIVYYPHSEKTDKSQKEGGTERKD